MAGAADGEYDYEHITPPTEDELVQIKERRAKYDQISKRMAELLLKGYKMLDEYCDVCSNVLMEERGGACARYCICCSEIDRRSEPEPSLSKTVLSSVAPEHKRKFKRDKKALLGPPTVPAKTGSSLSSVVLVESDASSEHQDENFTQALDVVSQKFAHVTEVLESSKSLSEIEDAARCLKILAETIKILRSCDQ